ncbi:MAG: c-type cytochrome [Actinobacteria bacterium]|nr:c-type cytochrome [Actinomycetota bacterium]
MTAAAPRPTPGRRRTRRALAIATGLVLAVALVNVLFGGGLATAQEDTGEAADDGLLQRGAQIFGAQCALCHGENGRGLPVDGPDGGPPLIGVGPASVDFMIRTGRMPLDNANERMRHREQQMSDQDRRAVVAYVTSLAPGEGPGIPDIDGWEEADLSRGLELFTTHCAACHGPTAAGIAVGQRDISSNLDIATPLEIAEAIRSGPGVMPAFNDEILPEDDVEAIVAWVRDLRERDSPGGLALGRSGPVSEGFIAWALGLGLLMIVMYLLGEKADEDGDDHGRA